MNCFNGLVGEQQTALAARQLAVLAALAQQYPGIIVMADFWRLSVVNPSRFRDNDVEVPVRLYEQIAAFHISKQDRWFEQTVGIIFQRTEYMIVPSEYQVDNDDIVIFSGEPWLVIEALTVANITRLKLDRQKERFQTPARFDPTYRQMGAKVNIL